MKFFSHSTRGFAGTRARLGMSQLQLAEHLGISKAAISMAETGRRQLPVAALLKLAELEIKMAANNIGSLRPPEENGAGLQEQATHIHIREMECELQVQKLETILITMTARYNQFLTQIGFLNGIIEKGQKDQDSGFLLGLQLHRERLSMQLQKCNTIQQTLLRNKIALLAAESHLSKSVRRTMANSE